jgi:hypothetical protein
VKPNSWNIERNQKRADDSTYPLDEPPRSFRSLAHAEQHRKKCTESQQDGDTSTDRKLMAKAHSENPPENFDQKKVKFLAVFLGESVAIGALIVKRGIIAKSFSRSIKKGLTLRFFFALVG